MIRWDEVIAIIVSPLIAYSVTLFVERNRREYNPKLNIFWTLMADRANIHSVEATRSLNSIDIAFKDDAKVREAWKRFYEWTNQVGYNDSSHGDETKKRRTVMLLEMARSLRLEQKITYDDVSRAYASVGFVAPAAVGHVVMTKIAESLTRDGGIPVHLVTPPASPESPRAPTA